MKKQTAKIIDKTANLVYLNDIYQNASSGQGSSSDPFRLTTWSALSQIDPRVLSSMYIEDWATRKAVDVVADDATREWIIFRSSDSEATKRLKEEIKRLDLKRKVRESLRLARLFGGCLLVPEISDGSGSLTSQLRVEKSSPIKTFHVIDNTSVFIDKYKSNRFSYANFGDPLFYRVASGNQTLIHESRVIRFDGDYLPSDERDSNSGWNNSIIIAIESALKMYGTSLQSVSSVIRDFVTKVLTVDGLDELLSSERGRNNLQERIQLLINGASVLGMTIIGGDEEYKKIQSPTSGLPKLVDILMDQLSAATGIPRTRFFSQQLGTLAGAESTTRDYYDFISRYQEEHLLAQIEKIVNLILFSIGKGDVEWEVSFKPLWQISETKKADVYKRNAETMMIHIQNGIVSREEARKVLANLDVNIFSEFDIDVNKKVEMPTPEGGDPQKPNVTIPNERPKKTEDGYKSHVHQQDNGEMTGVNDNESSEHVHQLTGQVGVTGTMRETYNSHIHLDSFGNETGEAIDVSTFRSEV